MDRTIIDRTITNAAITHQVAAQSAIPRRVTLAMRGKRLFDALVALAPGLVLIVFYARRIGELRANPALSSGTPSETVIAMLIAAFVVASFLFAKAALAGRLARGVRAFGLIVSAGCAAGITVVVLLLG